MKLKRIRQTVAILSILAVTSLFLDFTGVAHVWFGWMAKIQSLPALLALNVGVIIALIVATLLFGRIYCSVICPLGIMQDGFGFLGQKARKPEKQIQLFKAKKCASFWQDRSHGHGFDCRYWGSRGTLGAI